MRFVAIVLLVLGLVSVNNGLTLVGSPLSVQNLTQRALRPSGVQPGSLICLPAIRYR